MPVVAHVRHKFVEALQCDSRWGEIMNLISEYYWTLTELRPVKYIADVLRKFISGETYYASLLPVHITK